MSKQPFTGLIFGATSSFRNRYTELSPAGKSFIAGCASAFSIWTIYSISHWLMNRSALAIVASMGAVAVIVFQFPGTPATRSWPIIGGHLVSALVGVSVSMLVADRSIAASLAVGLSLVLMHFSRCMHPPGGGTALVAVVGGPAIHEAGYRFVLFPTLINAVVIAFLAAAYSWLTDGPKVTKDAP